MKLNNIELSFDNFASEMAKLKNEKHFDYLVTIIGEDFGEEGLGCIYILENTQTNERCSVKTIAKKVDGSDVIPTVINLWKVADLLEREVFDFVGIKFLGHPDMRRLFLRTDFQGYPLRKDFDMSPEANKFPCTDVFTQHLSCRDVVETVAVCQFFALGAFPGPGSAKNYDIKHFLNSYIVSPKPTFSFR